VTAPPPDRLFEALEKTWPAAECRAVGPWTIRVGKGGGQRVSAATANGLFEPSDIATAEDAMRDVKQIPLFMLRESDTELDQRLADRGYELVDPVSVYLAPVADLAAAMQITQAMPSWPPLAAQLEIWSSAGIGPARTAIMERCDVPKTSFLGRTGDTPAGTAFVGLDGDVAMVHAIEVSSSMRRRGVGVVLMRACANWGLEYGATWLCLAVTRANAPANALYRSLGMTEATRYHYRRSAKGIA